MKTFTDDINFNDIKKIIDALPERCELLANNSMKKNIPEKYHHLIRFNDFINHDCIIEYYPERNPMNHPLTGLPI